MLLSADDVRFLLDLLSHETVLPPTTAFPYRVSKKKSGYSDDARIAALQGKLSIMLQALSADKSRADEWKPVEPTERCRGDCSRGCDGPPCNKRGCEG